jgi:von Willebrand factor type A domain
MTPTAARWPLFVAAWTVAALHAQVPVFRAGVDVVTVPVSVTKDHQPVLGLTAGDFVLTDNGVPQAVDAVAQESLPIDIILLLDTSASIEGQALTQFADAVAEMTGGLQPSDRIRLVSVRGTVTDLGGMQAGGLRATVAGLGAAGGTSLYNALATALIVAPRIDRLQLVLLCSDGLDTTSFIGAPDVGRLAPHSAAVLYVGLRRGSSDSGLMYTGGPNTSVLRAAAESTGGRLVEVRGADALRTFFTTALDTVRTGYLLRYAPEQVAAHGWHDVAVRTRTPGLTVRARKGYDD